MNRAQKASIVEWLKQATQQDETVIFSTWSGLKVADEGELRLQIKRAGGVYKVVKNTLLKIGLAERSTNLDAVLKGNTAVTIGADPVAIAKIWKEFSKKNEKVQIKAGIVGTNVVTVEQIKALADLPSKEQMIAQLLGMLQQPMTKLASVLQAPMRDLASVLKQIQDQK